MDIGTIDLYGIVAGIDNGTSGLTPIGISLVVGVEMAVIGTQIPGVVFGIHGVGHGCAVANTPAKIMSPIGRVGSSDINNRTAVIAPTQKCLAKTCIILLGIELAREAAIANHNSGFVGVGEGCCMVGGKIGSTP